MTLRSLISVRRTLPPPLAAARAAFGRNELTSLEPPAVRRLDVDVVVVPAAEDIVRPLAVAHPELKEVFLADGSLARRLDHVIHDEVKRRLRTARVAPGQRCQRVAAFRLTARSIGERAIRCEERGVDVAVVGAGIHGVRVARHELLESRGNRRVSGRQSWLPACQRCNRLRTCGTWA